MTPEERKQLLREQRILSAQQSIEWWTDSIAADMRQIETRLAGIQRNVEHVNRLGALPKEIALEK